MAKSTALTLLTPTGPLPATTQGVYGTFVRDLDPDPIYGGNISPSYGDGRMRYSFPDCIPDGASVSSGTAVVNVPGYKASSVRFYIGQAEGGTIELEPSTPPFPSRAEACSIQTPFQGVYVWSKTFSAEYQKRYGGNGQVPLFGSAYLDFIAAGDQPSDLLAQYDGFSHVMLFLGRNGPGYNEVNQPYGNDQLIPYCEAANKLDWFVQQTDIVIASGKKPMFVLDGEGDPSFIRENFERFVAALRHGYDRTQYGPFTVAFDGVWPHGPGWTPDAVVETIQWMRSVLGEQGYLFFWYGNGPADLPYLYVFSENDYADPRFDGLDGVLTTSGTAEAAGVSMANKAQYMVREPNFSEFQPSFHGPFILHDCSRGPRFWGNIESWTYETVRDPDQNVKSICTIERQQMKTMNIPCAG